MDSPPLPPDPAKVFIDQWHSYSEELKQYFGTTSSIGR